MNNCVKIVYKGKEFVGQIRKLDGVWQYNNCGNEEFAYYDVEIIEKDTNVVISGIRIKNFYEIERYEENKNDR